MTTKEFVNELPTELDESLDSAKAFNAKVKAVDTVFGKARMDYEVALILSKVQEKSEQEYLASLVSFRTKCRTLNAERDRILELPATGRAGALLNADKLKVKGNSAAVGIHNRACTTLAMEAYELLKHGLKILKTRSEFFRGGTTNYNQRALNRALNANEITAGKLWPRYLKLEAQKLRLNPPPMVRTSKGGR